MNDEMQQHEDYEDPADMLIARRTEPTPEPPDLGTTITVDLLNALAFAHIPSPNGHPWGMDVWRNPLAQDMRAIINTESKQHPKVKLVFPAGMTMPPLSSAYRRALQVTNELPGVAGFVIAGLCPMLERVNAKSPLRLHPSLEKNEHE